MRINNFGDIKTFFGSNKTAKQTIFKNTFWLALSSGISKLLSFFLFIYVARILGPTQYGELTFALAFILLFGIFSNLGLSRITVRELSREDAEKEYPALLSLKIVLLLGTLILVFFGAFYITSDPVVRKAIWILAFYVCIGNFAQIIYEFLEARQKMEYESGAKILEAILHAAFGFFIIFNFPSVVNLSYGFLASIIVFLTIFLIFFHFKIYNLRFHWNVSIWNKYLKMSWPLAFTGFFATIYTYIDSVMMGRWGMITETGWYNAAYRIVTATIIPGSIIATSFFPALSKAYKENKEKFQKIWNRQIEIMLSLAVPITVGGIILAPKIIDYIFGPTFSPSVLALQILILMTGIIYLYTIFYWILIVANRQKLTFWVGLTGAAVNIVLNLILIPKYSLYGAAAATIMAYFLMFFLFFAFTSKFTDVKTLNPDFFRNSLGIILCGAIMYFVISFPSVYSLPIIYSIPFGAAVFSACLYVYKKIMIKLILRKETL
ncbi:MAG: oligosaccharide flippase family protein [Patescibacteria group bacterium]